MTDESKNQLRADILNALQNPQRATGNDLPTDELGRLLTLGAQMRAGQIRQLPLGTTNEMVERAEQQHGEIIMSKQAGQWTAEDRAFILRDVNDWMKNR